MHLTPRQLAAAGALAAAGFLGFGTLTAASAQDSGGDDSTTSTTVQDEDQSQDQRAPRDHRGDDENCPEKDGADTDSES